MSQLLCSAPAIRCCRTIFDRLIPSLERTVEGLRRGSEPERLHYYETALRELREMRELYDNGC